MSFDAQSIFVGSTLRDWFSYWLQTSGGLMLIVLVVSIVSLFISQRRSAMTLLLNELTGIGADLLSLSPRRVSALADLTSKEAFRRKVLYVFVVFGLLFMFAGWFMGASGAEISKDEVKV